MDANNTEMNKHHFTMYIDLHRKEYYDGFLAYLESPEFDPRSDTAIEAIYNVLPKRSTLLLTRHSVESADDIERFNTLKMLIDHGVRVDMMPPKSRSSQLMDAAIFHQCSLRYIKFIYETSLKQKTDWQCGIVTLDKILMTLESILDLNIPFHTEYVPQTIDHYLQLFEYCMSIANEHSYYKYENLDLSYIFDDGSWCEDTYRHELFQSIQTRIQDIVIQENKSRTYTRRSNLVKSRALHRYNSGGIYENKMYSFS